jgi:uncharacterized protein YcfJ
LGLRITLREASMSAIFRNLLAVAGVAIAVPAAAQVTFYEREGFRGQSFTADSQIGNLDRYGFNDRASAAAVRHGLWEVCEDSRFRGRCVVLRPGRYPSLTAMGLNDRVSSVRSVSGDARIDETRYAPPPPPAPGHDYARGDGERWYEVNVTSVHAVLGPPEQRCWVEREQVAQERSAANVPAAIAGAVLGGILGHQIGNGRGQDLATAGGVVAGAAVGANIGRDGGQQTTTRDVEHCANAPREGGPAYWDVTYNFRGQEHRVQMTAPPGTTVTVNELGEPRQ